jgi:L-glyceraldehyde 3-phosphate reductase
LYLSSSIFNDLVPIPRKGIAKVNHFFENAKFIFKKNDGSDYLCPVMENYRLTAPRYEAMNYRRCGRSGILMSEISLGFWHNFGGSADPERCRAIVETAFDCGKALYAGISNYPPEMAAQAYAYLREAHVPCLVYQGRYNMLDRKPESDILPQAAAAGVGYVAFSPLAQGLLTDRYLHGIPEDSRMRHSPYLTESALTPELLARLREWNEAARAEGISLAQYALRWILRRPEVTSVIVGASSVEQLKDNLKAVGA